MGSLLIAHEPASTALVQDAIAADLAKASVLPAAIESVLVVAGELIRNAVRLTPPPADAPLSVEWEIARDTATIRVTNAGINGKYAWARVPVARDSAALGAGKGAR
jgi:hypothetical protein